MKDIDRSIRGYIESLKLSLDGKLVPVKPYKPSILTNKESYPVITFQRYNMKSNKTVQAYNSYNVEYNEDKTKAMVSDAPTIFDWLVQIDLWCLTMNDISQLEFDWITNNPHKVGTLPISYNNGLETYISPFILNGEMKNLDKVDSTTNSYMIHRRSVVYKIQVPVSPKSVEMLVAQGVSIKQK